MKQVNATIKGIKCVYLIKEPGETARLLRESAAAEYPNAKYMSNFSVGGINANYDDEADFASSLPGAYAALKAAGVNCERLYCYEIQLS